MSPNGRVASGLLVYIDDLGSPACQQLIDVLRRAMKLLGAHDEIVGGKAIDQLLSPALRHATHKAEDNVGSFSTRLCSEGRHLSQRLLFGHVSDTAGVEQDDISRGLRR